MFKQTKGSVKVVLMHSSGKKVVTSVVPKKGKTLVQQALMKIPKQIRNEISLAAIH